MFKNSRLDNAIAESPRLERIITITTATVAALALSFSVWAIPTGVIAGDPSDRPTFEQDSDPAGVEPASPTIPTPRPEPVADEDAAPAPSLRPLTAGTPAVPVERMSEPAPGVVEPSPIPYEGELGPIFMCGHPEADPVYCTPTVWPFPRVEEDLGQLPTLGEEVDE
jgi:hypothetical protein